MHLHLTNMYCIISCCTLRYMYVLLFWWGCICVLTNVFLGAFAKWRKATFSFVISVHLTPWNISAPTGWIFMKFYIWVLFWKSVKLQVLHEDQFTFLIISHTFLLRVKSVSDKSCRENQTHFF